MKLRTRLNPWLGAALLLVFDAAAASAQPEELALYAINVENGEVEQITAEPLPGHTYCGSPSWSPDGRRILFDATPPDLNWSRTRVVVRDLDESGKPRFADLGPGNCPTWSPDGKQIAFLLNPGAVSEAEPGIWIMSADGGQRRRLAQAYGIPKWSPDGKRLLIVSFSNPCRLSLIDLETAEVTAVAAEDDFPIRSVPGWAGDSSTLVAVVPSMQTLGIGLVDLKDPARARIDGVLWLRGEETGGEPLYPIFSAKTGRCAFVARREGKSSLYTFETKPLYAPDPLEPGQHDNKIASPAFSPDGTRILFCSDRAWPPAEGVSAN
jgi:Tol biopolymer transport system component